MPSLGLLLLGVLSVNGVVSCPFLHKDNGLRVQPHVSWVGGCDDVFLLIGLVLHIAVFFKEFETGFAVALDEVLFQLSASAEQFVETLVPEPYLRVVANGASVIDGGYVGPHTGAETHGTGLACGVKHATAQIVGDQCTAGVAYGLNFAVAGGVVLLQYAVVAASYYLSLFHYH